RPYPHADVEAEGCAAHPGASARGWSTTWQRRYNRKFYFQPRNAVCVVARGSELPKRKFAGARTGNSDWKRAGPKSAWPGGNKVAPKIGRIAGLSSEVRRVTGRRDDLIAGGAASVCPGQQSHRYPE